MASSAVQQPSQTSAATIARQEPRVTGDCRWTMPEEEENVRSALLTPDQLEVAFDDQKRTLYSGIHLVGTLLMVVVFVVGLVVVVMARFMHDNHADQRSLGFLNCFSNSDDFVFELPTLLFFFGVVMLFLLCAMVSLCNSFVASITQKCTVTSTHLLTSHGGFTQVEKKIPLNCVRGVTITKSFLINTLSIDTGSTYQMVTHTTSTGGANNDLSRNHHHQLKPEIVLRGVKNAVQVREFLFAKQQMQMWNALASQSPNPTAVPIAFGHRPTPPYSRFRFEWSGMTRNGSFAAENDVTASPIGELAASKSSDTTSSKQL